MTSAAITPIVMPKWGLEMREGTVVDWRVEAGARIEVGTPILDVETDKISNAVEAADAGLLRRKTAQPGETLPVKALLGVLAEPEVSDADIDAYIAGYVVPAAEAGAEEAGPAYEEARVDGIRVRYARRGPSEGTPVVFIHGFGGDLNNWLFNLDAAAEHSPVVALDLPGHGQSEARLPGASVAALAGFVAAFLRDIGVGRAHLVGHSLGGAIAAQLALDDPALVESIVLVSAAGLGDEINAAYTDGFVAAQGRRELKPVLEMLFADPTLVSRQMIDDVLKYKRLDGVADLLATLNRDLFEGGRQAEQPGAKLGEMGKRVLVVAGREDRVIPAAHAGRAPAGANVEVLEGAGHMVQMERSKEFNRLLARHVTG